MSYSSENGNDIHSVLTDVNNLNSESQVQDDLLKQILEALKYKSGGIISKFNEYFNCYITDGYFTSDGSSFTLRYVEEPVSLDDSGVAPAALITSSTSVVLEAVKDVDISFDYEFNMNPNISDGISTAVVVETMGAILTIISSTGEETDIFNDYTVETGGGSWSGELPTGSSLRLSMSTTQSPNSALYIKLYNITM